MLALRCSPVQQQLEFQGIFLHGPGGFRRLPCDPAFDGFKALRTEEFLQELQAVVGLGPEERRKITLGKHHHAGELFPVHPQNVRELGTDFVVP
ncbi:hypothetical protein PJL18_02449 [Paenarthrobacter nicotinovorans]|nr:hypothetical protein [Paenarthrobacter nicotinovorans]